MTRLRLHDVPAETATAAGSSTYVVERPEKNPIATGDRDHYIVRGDTIAPEDLNHDWTSHTDYEVWRYLTAKRHEMMLETLLARIPVQYRSGGNSLYPFVHSEDTCFLEPITGDVLTGDIVFCATQPRNHYYVHLVWRVYDWTSQYGAVRKVYVIGNNYTDERKKCNGWCFGEHLYGVLTKTQRGEFLPDRIEITE